jgi:hypothetical protein
MGVLETLVALEQMELQVLLEAQVVLVAPVALAVKPMPEGWLVTVVPPPEVLII